MKIQETKNIVHVKKGRVSLTGDSRGILTPSEKRSDVWLWAQENNITIEYQGTLSKTDLWYVKNEQDRIWFVLRWS